MLMERFAFFLTLIKPNLKTDDFIPCAFLGLALVFVKCSTRSMSPADVLFLFIIQCDKRPHVSWFVNNVLIKQTNIKKIH